MIPRVYTEKEVAARLHRQPRWIMEWLRNNPTDPDGRPLYMQLGRSKRFTGDHIVLIIDLILTQEEAEKPKDVAPDGFISSMAGSTSRSAIPDQWRTG